jgi:hypothetical protein
VVIKKGVSMGIMGDPKIKMHDDHGHTNPHPVHGAAFGGKKAAPFAKKEESAEGGKGTKKEETKEKE